MDKILKNRIKEYFMEFAEICQFKILGSYEIYFIDNKYYSNDTGELLEQIYKASENYTSEEIIEFIEEYI